MYMIFGFTAVTMAQGKRAVTRLQLEDQNREESPSGTPSPTMTAQHTVAAIATITPRLLPVSAAKGGARIGSRSGDSHAETIVDHAYRPTRMLVPSETDAGVVRYGSTFRPIRTGDDGQERANNGQNACRRQSARLTKTIRRMLKVVIILMEVIKNFVEVVINFAEMVINLSEMVRRVAGRIRGIIGRVAGMGTVKDRILGAASSVGSIDGVVVVATADYTLLIYISGSVSSVGRSINTMARKSSMLSGRGCVMDRRINIMLGECQHGGRKGQHGGRERANGGQEGQLGGRECEDKGNEKGEYRSTPLGCIANINYSATVTVARRLKETGDSSSTPPLPLVVMLSRLTPILTSSSATVSARFSDSAWL